MPRVGEKAGFQISERLKPRGDQPKAIAELTEGVLAGLKFQTLLGATGTGKSLDADEPLLVHYATGPALESIGEFVDRELRKTAHRLTTPDGTEVGILEDPQPRALSFDPETGEVHLKPIISVSRHRAPAEMYRVCTACGREVLTTADHNFFALRNGKISLVRTDQLREDDHLPIPLSLPAPPPLTELHLEDLLPPDISVRAEGFFSDLVATYGRTRTLKILKKYYSDPKAKLWSILNEKKGGVPLYKFHSICKDLPPDWVENHIEGAYLQMSPSYSLPLRLKLGTHILRLFGYYLAEGHAEERYLLISSHEKVVRADVFKSLDFLNIKYLIRPNTDIQISSRIMAALFGSLMGKRAAEKHFPTFWTSLSNEQLGELLRAYFEGDGGVEREGVSCTTASRRLAHELLYGLLRLGIWARLRRKEVGKKPYWIVTITGHENLATFRNSVGFISYRKREQLSELTRKASNTNVDLIPITAGSFREFRARTGLYQSQVAEASGVSRSAIGLYESGKRLPSRSVAHGIFNLAEKREDEEMISTLAPLLGVRWTKVKEVKRIPYNRPYVYDISVQDDENFLAGRGGMFVHNTFTIAHVIQNVQRPTLVIAHNKTLTAQLANEFRELFPHNAVHYFVSYYDYYQPEAYIPQTDTYIEKDASINDEIDRLRHAATSALFERRDVIIVASVSCIYGLGSPDTYRDMSIEITRGAEMDRDEVMRHLIALQYTRNDIAFDRGTFRARGDTLEIIPAYEERIVRVEFFGDEIDRITILDPITGHPIREADSVRIYPASHFITPADRTRRAIESIEEELEQRLKELRAQGKLLEAQRLEQRTRYDIEMMQEMGYCSGIENYSRHLDGRAPGEPPAVLLDYFPEDYLMVIDESHQTIPQIRGMYHGDRSRKETLIEYGFRLPSALDNRPLTFAEFEQRLNQVIFTSATPGPYELRHSEKVVEQIIRPTGLVDPEVEVHPVQGQVDHLVGEIRKVVARGERVLVTTLTKRMAEDLTEYLVELGIKARYLHSEIDTLDRVEILRDLRLGKFDVLVGINLLREGLDLPEVSLVGILDADKEGFLRSGTSLIQTIGRAARNVRGKVILYADVMTDSIKHAVDETNRRRAIQIAYNEKHGITPQTIERDITDILSVIRAPQEEYTPAAVKVDGLTREEILATIKKLDREMHQAADRLEFELAARLRDEIKALKKKL